MSDIDGSNPKKHPSNGGNRLEQFGYGIPDVGVDFGLQSLFDPTPDLTTMHLESDRIVDSYLASHTENAGYRPPRNPSEQSQAEEFRDISMRLMSQIRADSGEENRASQSKLSFVSHLVVNHPRIRCQESPPETGVQQAWLVDARNADGESLLFTLDLSGEPRWQRFSSTVLMRLSGRVEPTYEMFLEPLYSDRAFVSEIERLDSEDAVSFYLRPGKEGSYLLYQVIRKAVREMGKKRPGTVTVDELKLFRSSPASLTGVSYDLSVGNTQARVRVTRDSHTAELVFFTGLL